MDVDEAPVSERRASHSRVMDHSEGKVSSPKGKGKSRESTGGPSNSPKVDGVPRVKLTFRPSVNNLIHDANTPPSYPNLPASDRSSLSPPPPITLKFGLHQRSSLAEKASYSSSSGSSDDDSEAEAVAQTSNPRPKKKARPTPKSPTHTKLHPPPHTLDTGSDATGHRKSYDWLEPSVAGASHHGPPDRGTPKITGWVPEDDIKPEDLDSGKKKSHKKKPGGPGKAWRKGIKKSMLMSWKDGGGSEDGRGGTSTPGDATPRSMGGSPEPAMADAPPAVDTSTPFVPADAKALGFPVFSKPIVAPKLNLGAFPRVTTYFWLNNGGDVGKFPRKEKVRSWTSTERTLVGIGGGQLKFKTWGMGPQSELGRLVQADKEAKDQARLKSKAAAAAALAESSAEVPARPVLVTGTSFESVAPQEHPVDDAHGADGASEIGDGEESVASAGPSASPSVAKPKARPAKSKPPRKSKLAQEIHPVDSTTAIEDVI